MTSPYKYIGANGAYEFLYPAAGDPRPKPDEVCSILTEGCVCRTGTWREGDLGWAPFPSRNRVKEEAINAHKNSAG